MRTSQSMSGDNRPANAIFLTAALCLVLLVMYTLGLGGLPSVLEGKHTVEVAVFFPDSASWESLREGARACASAGLAREEGEKPNELTLVTNRTGRRLRLRWHHQSGVVEVRNQLKSLLGSSQPPGALVGSSNTVLTHALASTLASTAAGSAGRPGPVLLLPAASAVEVAARTGGPPTRLLDIAPGRTFRFCLNNQAMAKLVISFLADQSGEAPGSACVVLDADDSFSVDLARWFEAELAQRWPTLDSFRVENPSMTAGQSGASALERAVLDRIAEAARRAGPNKPLWIMLSLQGDAARQFLQALDETLSDQVFSNIRVLSGDGIGLGSLEQLATRVRFPIYCVSSDGIDSGPGVSGPSSQVETELLAGLILALDSEEFDAAAPLAALNQPPGQRGTFGRSLRLRDGERVGDDLGLVLALLPNGGPVHGFEPRGADTWVEYARDAAAGRSWRRVPRAGVP